jgi:hypothetical protein
MRRAAGAAAEPTASHRRRSRAIWPGGFPAGGENANPGDLTKYNQINPAIHYGDMFPKWINGETFDMRISRQAVAADNQRHVRYVPAGE